MSHLVGSGARAQSVLEHWLRFDPGVAELVAPSGFGKTAVAQSLGGDDVRLIKVSAPVAPDALLATLTRQLGVTATDLRGSLMQVREQARTARAAGFHTLVVVDHAEHAEDAVLALLSRVGLAAEDGDGVAVLLLANTSQRSRLSQVSPQGARIDDISLVPLSDDEADELINAHLNDGPWEGDGLSQLDRTALIAAAAGNPATVLEMLSNKRNGLPLVARPAGGRKRVLAVFAVALVLAFGAAGAWVWQWHQAGSADASGAEAAISDSVEPAADVPQPVSDANQPRTTPLSTRELMAAVEAQIQAPLADPPAPVGSAEQAPVEAPDLEPLLSDAAIAAALPAPAEPVALPLPQVAAAQAPAPKVSSVVVFAPATRAPVQDAASGPAEAAVGTAVPTPVPTAVPRVTAADEAQILSKSASSFTLQLFGTRDFAAAMVQKNRLPTDIDARIVEVIHQGKPWFVLIAGDYRTREDAQAATSSLPAIIIEQGFWVRSFEGLQNQIREARR